MKNKIKEKQKEFDAVQTFREIKEKISVDIMDMDVKQIKAYLKKNSLKLKHTFDSSI